MYLVSMSCRVRDGIVLCVYIVRYLSVLPVVYGCIKLREKMQNCVW
jgi:hypothetical protein